MINLIFHIILSALASVLIVFWLMMVGFVVTLMAATMIPAKVFNHLRSMK